MSENIEPHILKRYEIIQKMGKGAYGVVWKAIDKKTSKIIALKKVIVFFLNQRYLMHFIMQRIPNELIEKLYYFNSSLIMKI